MSTKLDLTSLPSMADPSGGTVEPAQYGLASYCPLTRLTTTTVATRDFALASAVIAKVTASGDPSPSSIHATLVNVVTTDRRHDAATSPSQDFDDRVRDGGDVLADAVQKANRMSRLRRARATDIELMRSKPLAPQAVRAANRLAHSIGTAGEREEAVAGLPKRQAKWRGRLNEARTDLARALGEIAVLVGESNRLNSHTPTPHRISCLGRGDAFEAPFPTFYASNADEAQQIATMLHDEYGFAASAWTWNNG